MRPVDRFALTVLAAACGPVLVTGCADRAGGPQLLTGQLAIAPNFGRLRTGIVEIARGRFLLTRVPGGEVAADTIIDVAPGADSVDLALRVPMLTVGETFQLSIRLISTAGDTVFRAGPLEVAPTTSSTPVPVDVPFEYVGIGALAAGVAILTPDTSSFTGETIMVTGVALDSGQAPIPGTPIGWESLDPGRVQVTTDAQYRGIAVAGAERGVARIVATLVTGQTDTMLISNQPLPTALVAESGGNQSARADSTLPLPLVARVVAGDGLGVAGLWVRFLIVSGGGTVSDDSVLTDAAGRAAVNYTLAHSFQPHVVHATTERLSPAVAVFNATLVYEPPAVLEIAAGDGQTTDAGNAVTLPPQVRVRDAGGLPIPGVTVEFTVTGGGGVIVGGTPVTDTLGLGAVTAWTLGTGAGLNTLQVMVGSLQVQFTATGVPGAAASLGFVTQPTSAEIGAMITPPIEVEILDQHGNRRTQDATTMVDIAIAGGTGTGGAVLSGTLTQTAVNGLTTFSDLSIDLVGAGYRLEASIPNVTLATSAAFDVLAGPLPGVRWISATSGNWSNPASWSTGAVPAPGDSVLIEVPGTYTVTLDVDASPGWLHVGASSGTQTLAQAANTLTISNAATIASAGVYSLSGGTVQGAGTVTIIGTFIWQGGTIGAGGNALLSAGATVTWAGGPKFLDSRSVTNATTIVWSAGDLFFDGTAALSNQAGATIDMQGDLRMAFNTGGTFANVGTFAKTSGPGMAELSLVFTNDGAVNVQSGNLAVTALGGSLTHGGTFTGSAGTTLTLSNANPNTQTFNGSISGFGEITLPNSSGTFTFNGPVSASHITIANVSGVFNGALTGVDSVGVGSGGSAMQLSTGAPVSIPYVATAGTISGTDDLVISDSLIWSFGGFPMTGSVTLGAGAITRIVGLGAPKGAAAAFVNNGSVFVSGGPVDFGGGITNAAGATFEIQQDVPLSGSFVNQGLMAKNGGASTATITGAVQNNGVLDVSSGTLSLVGDFTHSAGAVLQGFATLDLSGANVLVFDGQLNPGSSPGILTFVAPAAGLVLGPNAVINVELGGTTVGAQYDQFDANGQQVTFGGTLNVTLVNGFAPTPGDQFTILRALRAGEFAAVNLPTVAGITLDTISTATDYLVTASAVVPQILFAGDSAGNAINSGIFKVNDDGTNQVQVTTEGPPAELNVQPRWSPDRTQITYSARQPGDPNQLHIRSADGVNVFHLTSITDTSTFFPRYSPNGVHLAFQCGDGGYPNTAQDVCVIGDVTNPVDGMGDGTGKVYVTDAVDGTLGGSGAFAWNPQNPDQLAVVRDSVLGGPIGSLIWLINFDGSGRTPLRNSVILDGAGAPVQVYSMDWSPDGSFIAFDGTSGGTRSIFRIEVATGVVTQLTTLNVDHRPVVSPDNTEILFGRAIDIWILAKIPATGGGVVQMSQNMNFDLNQAGWDWSPDGSEIVVTEDVTTAGVVISKILRTTTATSFFTDAVPVGRRGGIEIQDRQPSWRP